MGMTKMPGKRSGDKHSCGGRSACGARFAVSHDKSSGQFAPSGVTEHPVAGGGVKRVSPHRTVADLSKAGYSRTSVGTQHGAEVHVYEKKGEAAHYHYPSTGKVAVSQHSS